MTGAPSPGPGCSDEICLTCSDQAVPVRVCALLADELALVEIAGTTERISVALVTARVGDRVLVHAKEAITVLADEWADEWADEPADGPAPRTARS